MRALVYDSYGGPAALRLETRPAPMPRPHEVQVHVIACGLNLSDWEALTGTPLYARIGGLFKPATPILGSDIVGEVTALGRDVRGWNIGDLIWSEVISRRGGFADVANLPADRIAGLPAGLDPVIAATLPQSGSIALIGMRGVLAGQSVLINGAGGGTGPLALQLAKSAGARVTGVDCAEKAAFMTANGADHTVDYRAEDFAATSQKYDLILDLVGTREAATVAAALRSEGRYWLVGGKMPTLLSVLIGGAMHGASSGKSVGVLAADCTPDILDQLGQLAQEGALRPHVAQVIGLSDIPAALADIGAGKVSGKIVFKPD